jgi:hypothetical protein
MIIKYIIGTYFYNHVVGLVSVMPFHAGASASLLLCDFETSRKHSSLQSYRTVEDMLQSVGFAQLLGFVFRFETTRQGLVAAPELDSTVNLPMVVY